MRNASALRRHKARLAVMRGESSRPHLGITSMASSVVSGFRLHSCAISNDRSIWCLARVLPNAQARITAPHAWSDPAVQGARHAILHAVALLEAR